MSFSVLLHRPLLLLGDITGLLWTGGIVLLIAFVAVTILVAKAGKRNFVDQADTPAGQERRLLLLIVLAPVLALIILYSLLIGF